MIMFGYDVFNATSLVNIPVLPVPPLSRRSFLPIQSLIPVSVPTVVTRVNGYAWSKVDVEHNNGNENHLRNLNKDAIDDLFEWSSGSDSVIG